MTREPRSGFRVPEFDRDDLREFVIESFRLLYRIRHGDCEVLAFNPASRDLSRLFRPPQDSP